MWTIDLAQLLTLAVVTILIWELFKAIISLAWEEIRPGRKRFYGPTHKQYYDYRKYLKQKNG